MIKNLNKSSLVLFLFFLFPTFSFANIIFSEIMYDPEGVDTGYEWVEVENTKKYEVSLKGWKFCEGAPTCHSLPEDKNDNFKIKGNSFGIITDDREKFLEKNSVDESIPIIVSTGFVLVNTGERIQLKDNNGVIVDDIKPKYNTESGGKNGSSLSIFSNVWKNGKATAGKINIEEKSDIDKKNNDEDSDKDNVNTSYVEVHSSMYKGKKKLKAEINEMGVIMAGSRVKFLGKAYGVTGAEIYGVDFIWNMGDGAKDNGQFVHHSYDFPSEYIVNLTVKSRNFSGSTKIKVKVIEPSIEISDVKMTQKNDPGFVKIKNNSNEILNIEDWIISVDGENFLIPQKTYIEKKSEIIFSNRVTKLLPIIIEEKKSRVALLFPNGERFFNYNFDKVYENEDVGVMGKVLEKNQVLAQPKPAKKDKKRIIYHKKKNIKINKGISLVKNGGLKKDISENNVNVKKEEKKIVSNLSDMNNDFFKDEWPLLSFISILGIGILGMVFSKKEKNKKEKEGEGKKTKEDFATPNPHPETNNFPRADDFKIEEIK